MTFQDPEGDGGNAETNARSFQMSDYVRVFVLWIRIFHLHFLIQIGNVLIREWAYNNYSLVFLNSVN